MLQRLTSPFREFGPGAAVLYLSNRLLNRISPRLAVRYHDWMVQPVPDKPLLSDRIRQRIPVREIPRDAPEMRQMKLRPGVLDERLAQDTVCLGAFKNGEMVGYMWLAFHEYHEDEARCTFVLEPSDQSVFDFDVRVDQQHRLGFTFAALWDGASTYLREHGVRYSFSRLDHFNQASRRAHDHLGWRRVGGAVVIALANLEVIFATRQPRIFVTANEQKRARYLLTPEALTGCRMPEWTKPGISGFPE